VRDLGREGLLVHVAVRVKNESAVMMRLVSGEVRISPVLPLSPDVVPQLDAFRRSESERGQEIDWPGRLAYEFDWSDNPREIEPHESDTYDFDFVVDGSTVTFEVYSYFSNPTKKRQDIGWGLTTLHDVGGENESAGPSRVEAGS
jgi:hypothetical protein